MKKKKLLRNSLLGLLGVTLMMSTLAGCATNNGGSAATTSKDTQAKETQAKETQSMDTEAMATEAAITEKMEETEAPAAAEGDVTLRISTIPGNVQKMLQMNADEFMKKYPNVTINIEEYPEDQYQNQAPMIFDSDESRPDIAWYWKQMWYDDMAESGTFLSLDDVYESEKWVDALGQSALDLYTSADGQKYSVPHDMVWTPNLYYNKDIFEEVGVEVPKTMDELFAISAKLKEAGYIPCAIGATSAIPGHIFNGVLTRSVTDEQYTKLMDSTKKYDEINYESPEVVGIFATVKKLADEVFQTGATGVDSLEAQSLFIQGKAAMYSDGSWAVANIMDGVKDSFKYDVFQLPAILPELGTPACTFIGDAVMVLAKTEHPDLAKEFVAQIISKEMQSKIAEAGIAAPIRNDVDEATLSKMGDLYIKMYSDMREFGTKPLWYMTQGAELTNKSYEIVSSVMTGSLTPEEAAAQFQGVYDSTLE